MVAVRVRLLRPRLRGTAVIAPDPKLSLSIRLHHIRRRQHIHAIPVGQLHLPRSDGIAEQKLWHLVANGRQCLHDASDHLHGPTQQDGHPQLQLPVRRNCGWHLRWCNVVHAKHHGNLRLLGQHADPQLRHLVAIGIHGMCGAHNLHGPTQQDGHPQLQLPGWIHYIHERHLVHAKHHGNLRLLGQHADPQLRHLVTDSSQLLYKNNSTINIRLRNIVLRRWTKNGIMLVIVLFCQACWGGG